jgi:hypothetical protein
VEIIMSRKVPRTKFSGTVAPVPLLVSTPRQGSSPQAETRAADAAWASEAATKVCGSGRRLAGVPSVALARGLEPGRPGSQSHDTMPAAPPVGWNNEYPSLPGRGAHEQSDDPKQPAIKLVVTRSTSNGIYYLEVRLILRDDDVERAIHAHYISEVVTYLDVETRRAWEKHRDALIEETAWRPGAREMFLSPVPATDEIFRQLWVGLKRLHHDSRNRGLEVTVNNLLGDGMTVWADTLDEVREIERSILFSVDHISMSIEVGLSFDNGEQAIYAPGSNKPKSKTKTDDGGTPPDEWEP